MQVPRTAIALPLALISSIIFVVSGIISILCFFTNLAFTQSIEAPVSDKDLNVDKVLLFVFTLRFISCVILVHLRMLLALILNFYYLLWFLLIPHLQ